MSYIPDCRNDENYNEKFLNEKDAEFIRGFDWAVEMVLDNIFNNLDVPIQNDYVMHLFDEKVPEHMQKEYEVNFRFQGEDSTETRKIETYADYIRAGFLDYAEMERDELITSMIDAMDDEEYERNKQKAYEEDK